MTKGVLNTMARGGAVVLMGAALIGAVVAYDYIKPTAAPSAPITAVAIAPASSDASAPVVYEIDTADSRASYAIDEVLRGAPVTVVGQTDQVAGQLALNLADLDSARLGAIQINARALATDETQRDRAVQNRILLTDQYEYITFTPTELLGLPEDLATGETAAFQVVGDLTIRDVTRAVTFDATLTPLAADRLTGSATTTIRYADWGISIPEVPFVASVGDEVRLELAFEAEAQ